LHGAPKHALRRPTYAAASVGVSRSPVSRLVSRAVCRCARSVLIAEPVRTACGRVLVLTHITRLRGRAARKAVRRHGAGWCFASLRGGPQSGGTASAAATRARAAGQNTQLCVEVLIAAISLPVIRADRITPLVHAMNGPSRRPSMIAAGAKGYEPDAHSSGARPGGRQPMPSRRHMFMQDKSTPQVADTRNEPLPFHYRGCVTTSTSAGSPRLTTSSARPIARPRSSGFVTGPSACIPRPWATFA
jgi:hypothetical protein